MRSSTPSAPSIAALVKRHPSLPDDQSPAHYMRSSHTELPNRNHGTTITENVAHQCPSQPQAMPAPLPNCLLVVGFHPDETSALQQHIRTAHPHWHVAPILRDDLQHDVTALLERCASGDLHPQHTDPAHVLLGVGRIVLCSGQDVLQGLYELQALLVDEDSEEQPAPMFGVVADDDAGGTVGERLEAVRTAFGEVHGLMLPLMGRRVDDPDLQARLGT